MKIDNGPLQTPQAPAFTGGRAGGPPDKVPAAAGRFFLPFCFMLLLLITAGCPRPPGPVERPPVTTFDTSKLKERSDFWRDFQCKFRLRVDSQTAKFSSRAIIFVEGQNSVRFETFTPFGQTAALYVFNKTGPELLIPSQKVIFTARRQETLVHEFLGINLPVDIFSSILTASTPPEEIDHMESRFDAGARRLVWNGEGKYLEWQISPANSPALQGAFVRSGEFEGRVTYDPPVAVSKEALPDKIRISSKEWSMEVLVEELKPTSQFPPSTFSMPNLPDMRKVDLDTIK
jgi:outer membrane biogenesis lipoprotein LolB